MLKTYQQIESIDSQLIRLVINEMWKTWSRKIYILA